MTVPRVHDDGTPVQTSEKDMRRAALRKDDLRAFGKVGQFVASRCCAASLAPAELKFWPGVVFFHCGACGEPMFPVVGKVELDPRMGRSSFDEHMDIVWKEEDGTVVGRVVVEEGSSPLRGFW